MKILINVPSLNLLGGVSNHYIGLRPFWKEDVQYNVVGKRSKHAKMGAFWLPFDLVKFLFKLLFFHPDVVLLNPSLGKTALIRDSFFLKLSVILKFKTAIMIHGFDWDYAYGADWLKLSRLFNKASLIFVLASSFKKFMMENGVKTPIHLTTTKVDDRLLKDFDINKKGGVVRNLLFLARIEKTKGVYIAIDTYKILKEKYPKLSLSIVGDGSEIDNVRKYVLDENLKDVRITGPLYGNDLIRELQNGDLASSSSSYGEGMPTVVLEQMAFGMSIFTRNVGGLPDFFENGKMGYITDSLDPKDFAEAMIPYIENAELTKKVARYNHEYAIEHFLASKVARSLETTLRELL